MNHTDHEKKKMIPKMKLSCEHEINFILYILVTDGSRFHRSFNCTPHRVHHKTSIWLPKIFISKFAQVPVRQDNNFFYYINELFSASCGNWLFQCFLREKRTWPYALINFQYLGILKKITQSSKQYKQTLFTLLLLFQISKYM